MTENTTCEKYIKKRERSEIFGALYGSKIPDRDGIVTDITTLPDETLFYVHNGCWQGFIKHDDNRHIIYVGASKENPTQDYMSRIVIEPGYSYDALITILDGKEYEHHIVLTDAQIECFMAYLKDNDMPIAFGNSDWLEVYELIRNGIEEPEKIKLWKSKYRNNPYD
jgi:hypothetical protein